MFLHPRCWRPKSSGMWRSVVGWVDHSVLKDCVCWPLKVRASQSFKMSGTTNVVTRCPVTGDLATYLTTLFSCVIIAWCFLLYSYFHLSEMIVTLSWKLEGMRVNLIVWRRYLSISVNRLFELFTLKPQISHVMCDENSTWLCSHPVMTLKHVHLLILHISHFVVLKVSIFLPSITVWFLCDKRGLIRWMRNALLLMHDCILFFPLFCFLYVIQAWKQIPPTRT